MRSECPKIAITINTPQRGCPLSRACILEEKNARFVEKTRQKALLSDIHWVFTLYPIEKNDYPHGRKGIVIRLPLQK